MTDDSAVTNYKLTVAGRVANFVTIVPRMVRFSGNANTEHKAVVRIIPEKKYPFDIIEVKAVKGQHLRYHIEDRREQAEKAYMLHIENRKNDAGSYYDVVVLKTDSAIQPELKINVMARLAAPTAVPGDSSASGTDPPKSDTGGPAPRAVGQGAGQQAQPTHNVFLEMIKKMQQQKADHNSTVVGAGTGGGDPAGSEGMRNKFEELIKRAREQMADSPGSESMPTSGVE